MPVYEYGAAPVFTGTNSKIGGTTSCAGLYEIHYYNLPETRRRLKELRKDKKLSIKAMSDLIRWSEEVIEDNEKVGLLGLQELQDYSRFFNKPISYFLAEDEQVEQLTLF